MELNLVIYYYEYFTNEIFLSNFYYNSKQTQGSFPIQNSLQ